ncbi:MAG TPA: hypothetical protein VGK58_07080 [Lacipirellulaceae bacterium]
MLKYLRIAVTALGLTACALLLALWVRSYWWLDNVFVPLVNRRVSSINGQVMIGEQFSAKGPLRINRHNLGVVRPKSISLSVGTVSRVGVGQGFSHLILVVFFFVLAALPWLPFRFTLRTLLIATTLIAILLATGAYLRLW